MVYFFAKIVFFHNNDNKNDYICSLENNFNDMKAMRTAKEAIDAMRAMADEKQREVLMRFFKTGKGEYGEGDKFLGLKVPSTRSVAAECKDMPREEVERLLQSEWHEARLCGLLVLVQQFNKQCSKRLIDDKEAMRKRDSLIEFYVANAERANNWDLVDLSAPKTLGYWLTMPSCYGDDEKMALVDSLAESDNLWKKRISMVCTWGSLQKGNPAYTLRYAERHLHHPHDLMHKAVGWMLREMGKRVSIELLRSFLDMHAAEMPRTALRYAIEKMDEKERRHWMEYGREK